MSRPKRTIRVHFNDGREPMDLNLTSVSALDKRIEKKSFFVHETKPNQFHMCYSESLFDDFTVVKSFEIVRENG
jgi:hypothetical protein